MRKIFVFIICLAIFTVCAHPGSVPDFSLNALDGSTFNVSDHLGKQVLIIDFWATWCKPCKRLLKKLQKIKNTCPDVHVIAISVDDARSLVNVRPYINSKGFDFTVLLDSDSQVVQMFNPEKKIPFTVIVDKDGNIVYTHTGYSPGDEKEIFKKITELSK